MKPAYAQTVDLDSLDPFDKGWVVGILEGEGTFIARLRDGVRQPYILAMSTDVVSTDEFTVRRMRNLLGGSVYGPYKRDRGRPNKPTWKWSLHRRNDVAALGAAVLPHLCERRQQQVQAQLDAYEAYATTKKDR